jgi:hypothetical protein
LSEPVVDGVGEKIALIDPAAIAPDARLSRPEIAELQAQLLIEEADEAGFVRVRRQDEIVVMRIGQEDDDIVAHRCSPASLKRLPFPALIIRLNP